MERWKNRIAVVTGASSGIGAAIALDLVKSGMIVIGLARRPESIEALKIKLTKSLHNRLHSRKCDVSNDQEIIDTFKWIEEKFDCIDVLVNNAGISKLMLINEPDNEQQLKNILQTNLWGLILCTKKAVELMKRKHVKDGHFININSVAGHKIPVIPNAPPLFNIYPITKYGITALTEVLRQEFNFMETQIKITSISPGIVATNIGDESEEMKKFFHNVNPPYLQPEDVSNCVLYVLGTPSHVQIHEIIIKPVGETIA